MRLIRPAWLKLSSEDGSQSVILSQIGSMRSTVRINEENVIINTRDLLWSCIGVDSPVIAVVEAKSGTVFRNASGDKISGYKKMAQGTLLIPLEVNDKSVYVQYKGTFGYVSRKDIDLIPIAQTDTPTGTISYHGKTTGTAMVNIRSDVAGKRKIGELKIGTVVSIADQKGDSYLVEGRGLRGWVLSEYLTLDSFTEDSEKEEEEKENQSNGQKINQGK